MEGRHRYPWGVRQAAFTANGQVACVLNDETVRVGDKAFEAPWQVGHLAVADGLWAASAVGKGRRYEA
ncbi:MAG: hypothetical protein ACYCW6_03230 [Candidatus Xenobia bacterium]